MDAVTEQRTMVSLTLEQNESNLAVVSQSLDRASASQRESAAAAAMHEESLAKLTPELDACRAEIEKQKGELRAVDAMLRGKVKRVVRVVRVV